MFVVHTSKLSIPRFSWYRNKKKKKCMLLDFYHFSKNSCHWIKSLQGHWKSKQQGWVEHLNPSLVARLSLFITSLPPLSSQASLSCKVIDVTSSSASSFPDRPGLREHMPNTFLVLFRSAGFTWLTVQSWAHDREQNPRYWARHGIDSIPGPAFGLPFKTGQDI